MVRRVVVVMRRRRRRRGVGFGGVLVVSWCRLLSVDEEEEEEKRLVVRVIALKTVVVRGIGGDAYLEACIDARTHVQVGRLMAVAGQARMANLALILSPNVRYRRLHRAAQAGCGIVWQVLENSYVFDEVKLWLWWNS